MITNCTVKSSVAFLLFLFLQQSIYAQHSLINLIPGSTATHTAVQSGSWFDTLTWQEHIIPGDAAIVHIPMGVSVTYEGQSDAHLFAVRVDGAFTCKQISANDTTTTTFHHQR